MRASHLVPAVLLVAAGLTRAADPDRSIPAEPHYATPNQMYCLLVFGPEAKTRVWFVRDGESVYIHASPDGKAPAEWRQVGPSADGPYKFGDVWADGGKVRYTELTYATGPLNRKIFVKVGGQWQEAGRDRGGKLAFGASPAKAPIIHFGGPLTLDLFFTQHPLSGGENDGVRAVVGTPGVGPGTFALFETDSSPPGAWPTAVVEYPGKDGGAPVVAKVRLAVSVGASCGGQVRADMPVGSGIAKVTLAFDEWKDANIKPAVVEIPVNPNK